MALRRAARAALFTHTSRRSLTIDLALVPGDTCAIDPAYPCTVNPIVMLAQAFWDSWESREVLSRMLFAADKALRETKNVWSKVTGPVSAALASCFRIGWALGPGVGKLCTADGETIDLCRDCPPHSEAGRAVGRRDLAPGQGEV